MASPTIARCCLPRLFTPAAPPCAGPQGYDRCLHRSGIPAIASRFWQNPDAPDCTPRARPALPSIDRGGRGLRRGPDARVHGSGPGGWPSVPTLRSAFKGCFFEGRCPRKIGEICETTPPPRQAGTEDGHDIYCHIPLERLDELSVEAPTRDVAPATAD